MSDPCYGEAQVLAALNRAADDVLDAINADDEGVRDAVNLVVNAAAHYLSNPESSLNEAIEAADYGVEQDVVLGWAS